MEWDQWQLVRSFGRIEVPGPEGIVLRFSTLENIGAFAPTACMRLALQGRHPSDKVESLFLEIV